MRWQNGEGQQHNHTWEIICEIKSRDDHMLVFKDMDEAIAAVTEPLSGRFLNELPDFTEVNPSLENLTEYLFGQIEEQLSAIKAKLWRLEVGESPTHFYCISSEDYFN